MDEYYITEAMIQYGGSFVHGLGKLFRLADDDNQQRLRNAFPEYFLRYKELAEMTYEKRNNT